MALVPDSFGESYLGTIGPTIDPVAGSKRWRPELAKRGTDSS